MHYVAAGCQLFEQGEKASGAFYTVARFLSRGFLWDNVRVVGGAYGGGCALNPSTGGFAFSSYRDPNVQGTLDIYGRSAEVIAETADNRPTHTSAPNTSAPNPRRMLSPTHPFRSR